MWTPESNWNVALQPVNLSCSSCSLLALMSVHEDHKARGECQERTICLPPPTRSATPILHVRLQPIMYSYLLIVAARIWNKVAIFSKAYVHRSSYVSVFICCRKLLLLRLLLLFFLSCCYYSYSSSSYPPPATTPISPPPASTLIPHPPLPATTPISPPSATTPILRLLPLLRFLILLFLPLLLFLLLLLLLILLQEKVSRNN